MEIAYNSDFMGGIKWDENRYFFKHRSGHIISTQQTLVNVIIIIIFTVSFEELYVLEIYSKYPQVNLLMKTLPCAPRIS